MSLERILCGIDFSETSVRVYETAAELAQAFRAELHVMHVIEVDPRPPDLTLEQKALSAMEALVAPAQETLHGNLTTEVTTGRAFIEIVDRARSKRVDLIVVGAKGLTLLEEAVYGGTMEHVVKEAPCSVLVVRH